MLHLRSLTYRIAGRTLIDGADAHIPAGSRVGLVGRNGTGKTTLFKLILGDIAPDGGEVVLRPRAKVGTVAQEAPAGDIPLLDCVLAADPERTSLLDDLAVLEADPDAHGSDGAIRMAEIHERLEAIGAHAAPARAATILAGLGFAAESHDRPVGEWSGGWRMRVALAAALFAQPDLLLLDEPTNHLDLEATLWLESFLASYPGTLLVISHDRTLLDKAVDRIVHLEGQRLTGYAGGYSRFERTRREQMETQRRTQEKQLAERKHMQAFIDRFRAKATKARQAQSRLKQLEKMGPVVSVIEEKRIPFDFPDPDPLPPPILTLEGGLAGYGDKTVLSSLSLRLDQDDRVALLGPNGNGKSTLAKVLSGSLELMAGKRTASHKLRLGFFAQHQMDSLRLGETALGHGRRLMGDLPEAKIRAHLGRFG
ncbi:MAG: ABC-F family ATP-binding cassette domain-containing protein, partial [Rhodospirillaceae bacterium]